MLLLIRLPFLLTRYMGIRLWRFGVCFSEAHRDPALTPHSICIKSIGKYETLTKTEIAKQHSKNMRRVIRKPIVVTCMYNGNMETITVPMNRVFDGDSLKKLFCIKDDGIAWAIHDWLYHTHAFDKRSDGTTTQINLRWPVDELMYSLLILEGYKVYGKCLQSLDVCMIGVLDRAWDATNKNTFVRPF